MFKHQVIFMKKPDWLKQIENHSPEKLLNITKKLESYAQDFGRNLKNVSETLVESATNGKGRYFTVPIPGVGDWVYSDIFRKNNSPKLRRGAALLAGTSKILGLAGYAITKDPALLMLYLAPTLAEEGAIPISDYLYQPTKEGFNSSNSLRTR